MHDLAVLHQHEGRAAGREIGEIAAGARRGLGVLAGEHRRDARGLGIALERQTHAGARISGGASAHRVHDEEGRTVLVGHELVHLLGRPQLADSDHGQFVSHRLDENGIVWHSPRPPGAVVLSRQSSS